MPAAKTTRVAPAIVVTLAATAGAAWMAGAFDTPPPAAERVAPAARETPPPDPAVQAAQQAVTTANARAIGSCLAPAEAVPIVRRALQLAGFSERAVVLDARTPDDACVTEARADLRRAGGPILLTDDPGIPPIEARDGVTTAALDPCRRGAEPLDLVTCVTASLLKSTSAPVRRTGRDFGCLIPGEAAREIRALFVRRGLGEWKIRVDPEADPDLPTAFSQARADARKRVVVLDFGLREDC